MLHKSMIHKSPPSTPPPVMVSTVELRGHSKNSINTLCYLGCLKKHHIVPIKNENSGIQVTN